MIIQLLKSTISLIFLLQFGHVGFIFSQLSIQLFTNYDPNFLLLMIRVFAFGHFSDPLFGFNFIAANRADFALDIFCRSFFQFDLPEIVIVQGSHRWVHPLLIKVIQKILIQEIVN